MENPPEALAHYWTSSTILKRLPADHLPIYEHSPPQDMFSVRPLNTKSPELAWGLCAVAIGLVGVIAGFVLGSFLEFGRDG